MLIFNNYLQYLFDPVMVLHVFTDSLPDYWFKPLLYESTIKKENCCEAAVFQEFVVGVPHKNFKLERTNKVPAQTCITTEQQCYFDKTIKRTKCSRHQSFMSVQVAFSAVSETTFYYLTITFHSLST